MAQIAISSSPSLTVNNNFRYLKGSRTCSYTIGFVLFQSSLDSKFGGVRVSYWH